MSTFDAALVKEQGVTFAVVVVRSGTINGSARESARQQFSRAFGGAPVVLMEQNSSGTPRYHGRSDLVRFCSHIYVEQLPWSKYSIN